MTREGSSDQRAEHKEERVQAREEHGEEKAAESEKTGDYWSSRENTLQKTVTDTVAVASKMDMELLGDIGL